MQGGTSDVLHSDAQLLLGKNEYFVVVAYLQDQYEQIILNLYVRPQQPIVSYLTPLTG